MTAHGPYFLGVDIGTSGAKAILATHRGAVVAQATSTYAVNWLRSGWAEQDPEDWWRGAVQAVRSCLADAGIDRSDVAAVSFSGQMHGSVLLDEDGKVVRPPILWCDVRTTRQCGEIVERIGGQSRLIECVANPALEGFTAPKLLWIREHEPVAYERIRHLLLPKDYVRYRMTGVIATEVSDASGTLLFDVSRNEWSSAMTTALGISPEILPPVLESSALAGRVHADAAAELGLDEGTPVIAGGADNACGAIGAGVTGEGIYMSSIGSSGVVLTPTGESQANDDGRIHSFRHAVPQMWYSMGVTLSAGLSLAWFRNQFAHAESAVERSGGPSAYDLLALQASKSPKGSRGVFFLPYLNGERTPHADANARGVFFGLSGAHERSDLIRAVFEGITYSLRDSMELMRAKSGREAKEIRAIGGGAKNPFWTQLQADILGAEVTTLEVDEGPAFGAAILAMVGHGTFASVSEAVEACVKVKTRTAPTEGRGVYDDTYHFYRSLYPALRERYAAHAELSADLDRFQFVFEAES